jgi:methylenetetrahydrofolate dehydrogenase (NADP+) / methenyltetrahydrofolate cyclohydrolase
MIKILDGRQEAIQVQRVLRTLVQGKEPHLAVILVGNHGPSVKYTQRKTDAAEDLGIKATTYHLPEITGQPELMALVQRLNADASVHGILVQLPLPDHINRFQVLQALDPRKDVDGLHPVNMGYLAAGKPQFVPCTPLGCLHLIHRWRKDLRGLQALVVGRSVLVGKPMAALLLAEDATVTQAHRYTENVADLCRQSDIIVSATGVPHLIQGDWIKPGACVIDVGITYQDNKLYGDVDFEAAHKVVGAITPVPGGVGPMTIAFLMHNIIKAYYAQHGLDMPEIRS